jgi:hypothetical protein
MMKRLTLLFVMFASVAFGQSDTTDLNTIINANFPNNTSNFITPTRLRTVAKELMRSSANLLEPNTFAERQTFEDAVIGEDSIKSNVGFYVWDGTMWVQVEGGGNSTLSEVLSNDNQTDGNSIFISDGDRIDLSNGASIRKGTTDMGNGGANGIAFVCSVQYELKWEAGRLYVLEQNGTTIREVSYTFNDTPDSNDDGSVGYTVGSRWVLDDGTAYVCTDSTTTAAVWILDNVSNSYWSLVSDTLRPTADTVAISQLVAEDGFSFTMDSLFIGRIPYGMLGDLKAEGVFLNPTKQNGMGGFIIITNTDGTGGDQELLISPDLFNDLPAISLANDNSFEIQSELAIIRSDSSQFLIEQKNDDGNYGIYMDSIEKKITFGNADRIVMTSDSIEYYNTDGGTYGTVWRYTPNDFWVTYINEGATNKSQFVLRPNNSTLTVTDSTDGNRSVGLTIENFGYLWLGEAGFDSTNAWFLQYDEFVGMQGQSASVRGWNTAEMTSGQGITESGFRTQTAVGTSVYAPDGLLTEITAGANSKLELQDSTVTVTGQLILDSYTGTQASAITPQLGMMIYVTSTNGVFNQTGFWAYDGAWVRLH